ncbi:MAG: hypothetical protein ABI425_06200 [Patescibacteria group bacterium]
MTKPKVAIIVPTIREKEIKKFLRVWQKELIALSNTYIFQLYVVEDNPDQTFDIDSKFPFPLQHFTWSDIKKKLGKDAWIIPRRTDAIRSFGVLSAYEEGCDYFITLDDDCYPYYEQGNKPGYFIETHLKNLTLYQNSENIWVNTLNGYKPRGYPYLSTNVEREITNGAVSHGLWVNVPDFDSITSLSLSKKDQYFDHIRNQLIPKGTFFPMCSMNLAWRRSVTPLMYFLLMGKDEQEKKYDYDRFGDIWCGLLLKKIIDKLDLQVTSGEPCIYHQRASNAFENLQKEAPGIKQNEILWKDIDSLQLTSSTIKELYIELASHLPQYSPYWEKLSQAMLIWIHLF